MFGYKYAGVESNRIFYREAGPAIAPSILLLHGFPTSTHMFRNLIPALPDSYYVGAPDVTGFGLLGYAGPHTVPLYIRDLANLMGQKPSSGTIRMPKSASTTPATSRWRPIIAKLLAPFAIFSGRHLAFKAVTA